MALEFWREARLGRRWLRCNNMSWEEITCLLPYVADLRTRDVGYASAIDWCLRSENVQGMFTIALNPGLLDLQVYQNSLCFERARDAMMFKLVWGGDLTDFFGLRSLDSPG
jgi:hypothetical protein